MASKDLEDIELAEVLILFADAGNAGGGDGHVEFRIALALRKRLTVVGTAENLFQRLPEVEVVETWNDALRLIARTPSQLARGTRVSSITRALYSTARRAFECGQRGRIMSLAAANNILLLDSEGVVKTPTLP